MRLNLPRQRKLHENPVHQRVGVEALDDGEQLDLGRLGRQLEQGTLDAGLFAGGLLIADIDGAGRVIPHEHRRQMRGHSGLRFVRGRVARDFGAQRFGDLAAIDDLCRH